VIDLDKAYTILVRTCGARDGVDAFGPTDRWSFIQSIERQLHVPGPVEYRFQGALGVGGKFRIAHGRVYVDCYPEDETDERRGRIAVANECLAQLSRESRNGL
jgi:hypothetical protein